MVETVTAAIRVLLLAVLAIPASVFGHRLDEYLQATIAVIEPGEIRLEINFAPGVAIAPQVISLVDGDRNGAISASEAAAYAELLKRDLTVRLDQRAVELKFLASDFPETAEILAGIGIFRVAFSVPPGQLAVGAHRLTLQNRHLPAFSVYLFNAARPKSGSIQIASQKRNENQSEGEIEFSFHPAP